MRKLLLGFLWLWAATATGQVSDATLVTQSNQVKNETVAAANTATRVGTLFLNLTNSKGNKQEANTWSALQTFTAGAGNAGLRLGTKSGADPTGSTGQMYFNTTSTQFRFYDGTWRYPTLNDGLNDNRILIASSNRATDDADLTFTGGDKLNATKFLGGSGTAITTADASTIIYAGSAASGNIIAQAVNVRQSVATTGVIFGDYVKSYSDHPSGTINQLLAIQGNAENAGAGTVTSARGILGGTLTTNGPITTAIGVKAEGVFIAGSGAVTTSIALDIIGATVGSGTVTNNYGLYQHGSTPLNVLEGKLGIGGSPSFPLDIQGSSAGTHVTRILNTSTGNASVQLQRTGGTTSTWEMVIPSATTNLVLYSGSNLFTFTTAGLLTGTSFQATGLTSTRVPIAGASGLIGDDADLTFTGGNTLNATNLQISQGAVTSGYYTPTNPGTANTNVDAVSLVDLQYIRVGNVATVSGSVDVDATAGGGTATVIDLTLAFASNLFGANQLAGSGVLPGSGIAVAVYADTTNDHALLRWLSQSTSNQTITFSFTYYIQ